MRAKDVSRSSTLASGQSATPCGHANGARDNRCTFKGHNQRSGNWNLSDPSSFGPTVAIEFTPIENWFEIEVGTGPMFGRGIREWDTDILFKKPFTLSDKVEFMIGAGPQWGNAFNGTTNAGVIVAGDFMFWPTPDRKLGWFLEPSYSYSFIGGHEQSLGVSVGLLIPIYAK
jgi:hypothetical protein